MRDPILESFLAQQLHDAAHLTASSAITEALPLDLQHYVLRFRCKGLVQQGSDAPRIHERFDVGIYFPASYLRLAHPPGLILQWLGPAEVFHPNIRGHAICLGPITPGEGLIDLAFRVFEVITFHRCSPHDPLNADAAQWVRHHAHELPLDRRPLLRPGGYRARE
jgi:hypothetical protein